MRHLFVSSVWWISFLLLVGQRVRMGSQELVCVLSTSIFLVPIFIYYFSLWLVEYFIANWRWCRIAFWTCWEPREQFDVLRSLNPAATDIAVTPVCKAWPTHSRAKDQNAVRIDRILVSWWQTQRFFNCSKLLSGLNLPIWANWQNLLSVNITCHTFSWPKCYLGTNPRTFV